MGKQHTWQMANGLNQTQLGFMVGEVPQVKNSDSLSGCAHAGSFSCSNFLVAILNFLFYLNKQTE